MQELEIVGAPRSGAMGFQPAATSLAEGIFALDAMLLVIITAISIFVTASMIYTFIRYNRKRNPTPATFTHNSPIEVAWTIVPVFILLFIFLNIAFQINIVFLLNFFEFFENFMIFFVIFFVIFFEIFV